MPMIETELESFERTRPAVPQGVIPYSLIIGLYVNGFSANRVEKPGTEVVPYYGLPRPSQKERRKPGLRSKVEIQQHAQIAGQGCPAFEDSRRKS